MFHKKTLSVICIPVVFSMLTSLGGCAAPREGDNHTDNTLASVGIANPTTSEGANDPKTSGGVNDTTKSDGIYGLGTSEDIDPMTSAQKDEIIFKPVFSDEKDRVFTSLEWKPSVYSAMVKPYKVKSDLSNIVNIGQFGEFTKEHKQMLTKNGFVVMPTQEEQLFYIYEKNEYLKVPSFITTDSVLQVYHIFFDYSLRTLEAEQLMGPLTDLTDSMLEKSVALYYQLDNPEVKRAALKNIIFFAVAQKALEKELPADLPAEAQVIIDKECALVEEASEFTESPLLGFDVNYTQFKPRGHYTRSENFEKYFKAMMWYGYIPMPLLDSETCELIPDTTAQALLITYCMFSDVGGVSDVERWEMIYEPTVFYVGSTDDLNLYHFKDLIVSVYGKNPDPETFLEPQNIDKLTEEAKKLPNPRIQAKWLTKDTPVAKQFRFMGQRYIPDSEILQKLSEPIKRPIPRGLDVMGVLGSDRAYDLLINRYQQNKVWDRYEENFTLLRKQFAGLDGSIWRSNMYYGWLWTLKGLLGSFGEGYPFFMTNQAWEDKSLSTALGSWAELRHDTILYAKQSGAECGGGEEPPVVKGYVEPNIEVYSKLKWLTEYSRVNLDQRGILPGIMRDKMERFEELLQFLITCSMKELRNEELTNDEYYQLLIYGGRLESLTASLAEEGSRWFEITSDADKNMAVIADVHGTSSSCLEAGVGLASQIYVAVPIGGEIYLTRGAVFSYYEFESATRLTDEEWQKMIKDGKQPAQPDWTESFISGPKKEIPVPEDPYIVPCR
jgi:hypothetical protein